MKFYQAVAQAVGARERCANRKDPLDWHTRWTNRLKALKDNLPHGSGFDSGSSLVVEDSTENRLVFETSFHHMNEGGMYDGWTEHRVIVQPSLALGFTLRVTGRDRNEIKDYIAQVFEEVLSAEFEWPREEA